MLDYRLPTVCTYNYKSKYLVLAVAHIQKIGDLTMFLEKKLSLGGRRMYQSFKVLQYLMLVI